jgi:L(+)-tartrate dehydratase beta subunit
VSAADGIREVELAVPFEVEAVTELRPGDAVFLTGTIFTGREGVYRQLFERNLKPPVDLRAVCPVNFHCSPAIAEDAPGRYRLTSVTATASFRFAAHMPRLLGELGVRAVIGKGGMAADVYERRFRPAGALYLTTVGYGLGAIYGRAVRRVREVFWKEELGLAQAFWVLEVERFGPLLVECDARGRSLFASENALIDPLLREAYRGLPGPILRRLGEETDPCREMV